jgi:F5/8 type C domain
MSQRARSSLVSFLSSCLSSCLLVIGLVFVACGGPEGISHKPTGGGGTGGHGTAGLTGTAGMSGVAGDTSGVAGQGLGGDTGQAGAGGTGGDPGQAGMTGTAGGSGGTTPTAGTTGQAGAGGTGGTPTAGTTGQAGAGGTGGTPTAGTTGQAGAGGTGGKAGSGGTGGTGGTPTAGTTGTAGAGGTGGVAPYTNWCSPVHWSPSASVSLAGDPPSNAIDGSATSRWTTGANQAAGQTFTLDFGGTVSLTQVVLDNAANAGDYPHGYDVGISANGTSFTSVGAVAAVAATTLITVNFTAMQGRYLRIQQTATSNVYWSINELRVACTVPGPTGTDPFDPANWTAKATPAGPAAQTADKAIDVAGAATRWATGTDEVGGEVFTLDVGSVITASQLWLDNQNDFPATYKLEVSTNGTTFTQVTTGAGAAITTKIVFPAPQSARYFRVTQTGTSNTWWSIYSTVVKP